MHSTQGSAALQTSFMSSPFGGDIFWVATRSCLRHACKYDHHCRLGKQARSLHEHWEMEPDERSSPPGRERQKTYEYTYKHGSMGFCALIHPWECSAGWRRVRATLDSASSTASSQPVMGEMFSSRCRQDHLPVTLHSHVPRSNKHTWEEGTREASDVWERDKEERERS